MMQKIESKKRLSKSRKSIAFDRSFSLAGGMFYQPINRSQKSNDASQFAEIQQMIAAIEDNNKSDSLAWEKFDRMLFSDELKQAIKDYKILPSEYTLLHLAVKHCRRRFCIFFLEELKIDVNVRSSNNLTPLHVMVKSNVFDRHNTANLIEKKALFKEVFDILIKHEADVNAQDDFGYTPLHYSVSKDNCDAAMLLLGLPDIIPYLEDNKQLTPLHIACKYGYDELTEILIDRTEPIKLINYLLPLSPASNENLPLHMICRHKVERLSVLKSYLSKVKEQLVYPEASKDYMDETLCKQDSSQKTIFLIAVENDHLNIVEYLLENFSFRKDQCEGQTGNSAVMFAAKNGSLEMLRILIKHNAVSFQPNYFDQNSLHIAAANNRFKFIRDFLIYEKEMVESNFEKLGTFGTSENMSFSCNAHISCACNCEIENYVPSVKIKDKDRQYTPLLTAAAAGHQFCVEELLNNSSDVELDAKDLFGNTIYHLCTEYDNSETIKYLFNSHKSDIVFSKNNLENTIFHCACMKGNLEMVKLLLNKIETRTTSIEPFLYSKNKDGLTCFHYACSYGYNNIVEYFLKEKRLNAFVEHFDNNSNTALHLATQNGHSGIVCVLLDHGADVYHKNEENNTAFDLSCRNGYFEISKLLISHYKIGDNKDKSKDYPLHVACYEGAHEVVKLLLLKGFRIDELNDEYKNCLDIAISQEHREVIRVLLNDENWFKLISFESYSKENFPADLVEDVERRLRPAYSSSSLLNKSKVLSKAEGKLTENPQLVAMFEKSMWDMIKLILDKCILGNNSMDFTIIDPPVKSISKHPLHLIARSGQENLLKHETTRVLLNLKWRYIPRFAFYFNLIFYLIFLLFFSLYSIELSRIGNTADQNFQFYKLNLTVHDDTGNVQNLTRSQLRFMYYKDRTHFNPNKLKNSPIYITLMTLICINITKELFQIFFLDGISYFGSFQNLMESFTYSTSLISMLINDYTTQTSFVSVSILFAFLALPLFIQKLRMFGLYVVAFRRTLTNSAKFFPIFLIIFTGFILSFRIRSNFDVNYFNTTSYSIIRTLTMVVGEFETAKMGLFNDSSLPNFIVYFLFIVLMCIIVLNLFVGIAVGEIKTVLDEADIQQTSMRIIFVLKVQSALNPFNKNRHFKRFFNMNFQKYRYKNENRLVKLKNKMYAKLRGIFSAGEHSIKLSDKTKRLEDAFNEMSRSTNEYIKSLKFSFSNQITDVESKLANSQRRLHDYLIDLSSRTNEEFDLVLNELNDSSIDLKKKLAEITTHISDVKTKFNQKLDEESKRLLTQIIESESKLNYASIQTNIKIGEVEKHMCNNFDLSNSLSRELSKETHSLLNTTANSINSAIAVLKAEMNADLKALQDLLREKCSELNQRLKESQSVLVAKIEQSHNQSSQSFKELTEFVQTNVDFLKTNIADTNKILESKMVESLDEIKFEFKSIKVSCHHLSSQIDALRLQAEQTQTSITRLNDAFEILNGRFK